MQIFRKNNTLYYGTRKTLKGGIKMDMETMLREEIRDELESLKSMQLGDELYKTTVDGLTKLIDKTIEIEKFNIESQEKTKNREEDLELKRQEMEDNKRDRLLTNGIAVAGIVIPSLLTIWGTLKSLKFEETGTVTTIVGRGFINKLLPRK